MKTSPTKRTSIVAIGLGALLSITACGSDEKKSSTRSPVAEEPSGSDAAGDVTISAGTSLPDTNVPDVSVPPIAGLSDDCAAYAQLFTSAIAGGTSGFGDFDDAISELQSRVPEELRGDVDKFATFYNKLIEVSAKYKDNPTLAYSDPELLEFFSDPEYVQAGERLNTWLSTECQTAGG